MLDDRSILILLLSAALALSGCSGGDGRLAVSGTVSLDGQPLPDASISFRPAPGNDANGSGAVIRDGTFALPAAKGLKTGKYLVTVQAFRKTGRMVPLTPGGKKLGPEMAPLQFDSSTALEATVVAGKGNRFDFQLKRSLDSAPIPTPATFHHP